MIQFSLKTLLYMVTVCALLAWMVATGSVVPGFLICATAIMWARSGRPGPLRIGLLFALWSCTVVTLGLAVVELSPHCGSPEVAALVGALGAALVYFGAIPTVLSVIGLLNILANR
jgi:hypothetical protein